jgi:hypothetical protein
MELARSTPIDQSVRRPEHSIEPRPESTRLPSHHPFLPFRLSLQSAYGLLESLPVCPASLLDRRPGEAAMHPASPPAALEPLRRSRSRAQAAVHPASLSSADPGRPAGLTAATARLRAADPSTRAPIVVNRRRQHL